MASRKTAIKKKTTLDKAERVAGTPKYPYTTVPPVLKKLLQAIPNKPKPPKLTRDTLKVWQVSASNNSDSAIRVLKKLGLIDDSGQPKPEYAEFMDKSKGPAVLGKLLQSTYAQLFSSILNPLESSAEELRSFFNVHSGGGEDAMRLQIQTFKVLAEFATIPTPGQSGAAAVNDSDNSSEAGGGQQRMPPVQIDLHIHLPENKSSRDYQAIIQDIARYIYGRDIE